MPANLTAVREMSGILLKSGKCHGKNLVREKLPKTVYFKLHICVYTGIFPSFVAFSTNTGMMRERVTLNMLSAAEA